MITSHCSQPRACISARDMGRNGAAARSGPDSEAENRLVGLARGIRRALQRGWYWRYSLPSGRPARPWARRSNMRTTTRFLSNSVAAAVCSILMAGCSPKPPAPTAADAQAFVKQLNEELTRLAIEDSAAGWVRSE